VAYRPSTRGTSHGGAAGSLWTAWTLAGSQPDLYAHQYEEFKVELRPSLGAVLTFEKLVPTLYATVMVIE
jgi:archaellin